MNVPVNEMKLTIPSCSANEGFARTAVAAFAAQMDPLIEELADIKTAVSEAVTNCIVHAYREKTGNIVGVKAVNKDDEMMLITTEGIIIRIRVSDTALLGRITSGVKLMNLKNDVVIASIAKVREDKSLIQNDEEEDPEDTIESVEPDESSITE